MPEIPTSWLIGEPDEPEIPAPMLDAATAAVLFVEYDEETVDEIVQNFREGSCYQRALKQAKAALEAAGVAEMAARIAELEAERGSGRCKQCGGTIDHYISCPKSKYLR